MIFRLICNFCLFVLQFLIFCFQSKGEIEKRLHEVLDDNFELEKQFNDIQQENKDLRVALINSQEDVEEWKRSYEALQEEGNQLFQTYERKCNMLKQVGVQLTECKSSVEEHKQFTTQIEARLQASRAECEDLKQKCRILSESCGKQESLYFSLKEEHNDALSRLEYAERKFSNCSSDIVGRDAEIEPLPVANMLGDLSRLASTISQCHALVRAGQLLSINTKERPVGVGEVEPWRSAEPADSPSAGRRGPSESRLSTSSDGGGWDGATPRRERGFAITAPRTPGQVLLAIEALSPSSLREHAESLAISNDLLRQVFAR